MSGELLYEYGKNPVNWGRLATPDISHTEKNISCGEELSLDLKLGENNTVQEIGFEGEGRLITIAAMSLLSEEMEENPLSHIEKIGKKDLLNLLEVDQLSPRRLKSALLSLLTFRNIYHKRIGKRVLDFGDLMEE
ncbi:iron-sulfur cluster assembly scaffold protein [Candidatus Peregrinibacteria bacterium]|nr:MAG: iron-sulfur cluster assembly scaffold protein [Candidatus Peregrinibacteria bacterium]